MSARLNHGSWLAEQLARQVSTAPSSWNYKVWLRIAVPSSSDGLIKVAKTFVAVAVLQLIVRKEERVVRVCLC